MNADFVKTYLLAQSEMGGSEVVLQGQPRRAALATTPTQPAPTAVPVVTTTVAPTDSLWKNAANINDFYEALRQHSIYSKSMRSLSFLVPNEIKMNAAYLLLFHSPQELTVESRGILERLFKKLGVDLKTCAISFFFKCDETAMPREKLVLKEMLFKDRAIKPAKNNFLQRSSKLGKNRKTCQSRRQPNNICRQAGNNALLSFGNAPKQSRLQRENARNVEPTFA